MYLKVYLSGLRDIIGGKHMNGKIGMRAFSMLLAGLLVSVVVVSMASAQTSIDAIAEEELADSVIITPDFSSQDIVVSPSLGEDDLITLVFPESWIKDRNSADYSDRVELADAQVLLKNECFDEKTGLRYFSPVQVTEAQSLTVLRIPKKMFELSLAMNDGSISFPMKYFITYPDLQTMLSEVRVATPSEPEVYSPENARSASYVSPPLHGEWAQYYVNSQYAGRPVHLEGLIKPGSFTNNGHEGAIYHEREIYLDGGDAIEYVFYYDEDYYGDKIWLGAAIYDNSDSFQGCPTIKWFDATSRHWYDYDFTIDGAGTYYIWFRDCTTGSWKEHIYYDNDDPSASINRICGSAEIYADVPVQHSFEAITDRMIDEYVKTNDGLTKLPGEVFSWVAYTGEDRTYCFMNAWIASGRITTYHECDSTL
ncbi:hypothetical protein [Methanoculleus sp.]|uniref:hypothetical protein n=1 Tax=Methanoculleus sp. TaxID=90427 RepID=UPI001BD3EB40|nr:hypothetical protein [Methanoculleus sp.]